MIYPFWREGELYVHRRLEIFQPDPSIIHSSLQAGTFAYSFLALLTSNSNFASSRARAPYPSSANPREAREWKIEDSPERISRDSLLD